jgi:starvation-inducible outer membrane lipoprotein
MYDERRLQVPYHQNVPVKQPRFMKLYAFVWAVCLPLVFTGCSSYHLIVSDDLKDQVNYELRFEDIALLPGNYKGELIVVGGEVLDIDQHEGKTKLVVCQQRLSANLTPQGRGCTPGGPFVTVWNEANLVDPPIRTGDAITFVGEIHGSETVQVANYVDPPIRKGNTLTFAGKLGGRETMQVKTYEIEVPILVLRSHLNWNLSHWETSSQWRNPG